MRRRTRPRALLAGLLAATLPGSAPAATSLLPSDFRPVAAEGSARATWVNPSAIGSDPWQSLVVEVGAREQPSGDFDAGKLAVLSLAASTGRTAYAYRRELDDVDGVPDWALLLANRTRRQRGVVFGSALEWRGGESQSLDATLSLSARVGKAIRAALVLEDAFAADVDGRSGARRWRGGVALRPRWSSGYLSWDYDRFEDADEGRHWFGAGLDRGAMLLLTGAVDDRGHWSTRVGARLANVLCSVALVEDVDGHRAAVASVDFLAAAITH